MSIFTSASFDEHETVILCSDAATGLQAYIAIHSTILGPGMGGCRIQQYASEDDAIADALRLSQGMTCKYAAAGLPYGGAKAVIMAPPGGKSEPLLLAFADAVERLGGIYVTAEDAGTTTADVRLMATRTRYVRNLPLDDDREGGLCTASGVAHAIQAAAGRLGWPDLRGRTAAIQGLGKVGMELCWILRDAGARLLVADAADLRVREAVARFDAEPVHPAQIHRIDADVFAPCALGGVLNDRSVPELRAAVVAGAANNQLGHPRNAEGMHRRGILYCPDYVANAGGVLAVAGLGEAYSQDAALARVATIRLTMTGIIEAAASNDVSTASAAGDLVASRIAAARLAKAA